MLRRRQLSSQYAEKPFLWPDLSNFPWVETPRFHIYFNLFGNIIGQLKTFMLMFISISLYHTNITLKDLFIYSAHKAWDLSREMHRFAVIYCPRNVFWNILVVWMSELLYLIGSWLMHLKWVIFLLVMLLLYQNFWLNLY